MSCPSSAVGASVVHPSTDYVFDGTNEEGYVESDAVNPISGYGRSKLAGEREVEAANPRHWIVRSSWLFGVNGRNFVDTMLGLAQDRDEVVVVLDRCTDDTRAIAQRYTDRLIDGAQRIASKTAFRASSGIGVLLYFLILLRLIIASITSIFSFSFLITDNF